MNAAATITLNPEKSGIEIRFTVKPDPSVIETMKEHGFRWSGKQKMWYAHQDDARLAFAQTIGAIIGANKNNEKKEDERTIDLWALTRTDSIINNYAETHLSNVKEIACIIRDHIKRRFPMCRWSVRSDYNSIDMDLLSSPFAKESEELKAIVHYAAIYAKSWNYDNSDLMSDYHDVNFYGCYESGIVSYDYEQRQQTEDEAAMCSAFEMALSAFNEAERIRMEKERAEENERRERARIENEAYERRRQENHDLIEKNAKICDASYYLLNCITTLCNKFDSVAAMKAGEKGERENCFITREVHLSPEMYDLFSCQLLDDYSFLEHMGGHATDDLRIKSDDDYVRMSKEERETVSWYNTNCVAVYCLGELKLVINPEGHSYARYSYLVDADTVKTSSFHSGLGIDRETYAKACTVAEMLEDASTKLIGEHDLFGTWNKENYTNYKTLMREYILDHLGSRFNVDAVRAIEIPELKTAMYDILENPVPAAEQLITSGLKEGDKFTLIHIGEFGSLTCTNAVFYSWETKKYAQYDDNIRLVFKPVGRRGLYEANLHTPFLIYFGYVQIPEDVLWEKMESSTPGVTCKKTRFLSCDRRQYDAVIERFKAEGVFPLVNTYKPIFG